MRDLYNNPQAVIRLLEGHGRKILALADGQDDRAVTPFADPKSIGKEHTFQQDTDDRPFLRDKLRLIAKELSFELHETGLYTTTVTLKITFGDMRQITRSRTGDATQRAGEIFEIAASLLEGVERRPIRLIGISLGGLSKTSARQISLADVGYLEQAERMDRAAFDLQQRFGIHAIKTAGELGAEKRLRSKEPE
ncbi:DNA polymerase IV [bioreactor metagenome]|uniref:DNA-directed DNA polymerase n=1 Tax=bioreactor metagenome TaxID=1076179 RepID=A0A645I4L2_9ZZZZ